MKFLINAVLAVIFFIWILPLGVFIKSSQEKLACGGQRAICMCGHMKAQAKADTSQEYVFQANFNSKEETNASGASQVLYCLLAHHLSRKSSGAFEQHSATAVIYRNPFLHSIEHVPKV